MNNTDETWNALTEKCFNGKMASSLGVFAYGELFIKEDHPFWIKCFIGDLLDRAFQGFPCLKVECWMQSFASDVNHLLDILECKDFLEKSLQHHLNQSDFFLVSNGWVYVRSYWYLEQRIAQHFVKRLKFFLQDTPSTDNDNEYYKKFLEGLNLEQSQAVLASLDSRFLIVAGGPGTGKTFTAARIVQACIEKLRRGFGFTKICIALLAPTGKAAVRLKSSMMQSISAGALEFAGVGKDNLQIEAMTLHRFFDNGKRQGGYFARTNPAPYQIILVDEASMIDARSLERLFESAHEQSSLILMGDPNQLPPVQSPGLFSGMVRACQAALHGYRSLSVQLKTSLRAQGKDLIEAAQAILNADRPGWELLVRNSQRVRSIKSSSEKLTREMLLQIKPIISSQSLEDSLASLNHQIVLCVSHHGPWGTQIINSKLYQILRSDALSSNWSHLDIPVMATVNQPEIESVNGQMGILRLNRYQLIQSRDLDKALQIAEVAYFQIPGHSDYLSIPCIRLAELEPAWAITVHKSQGSEFECVKFLLSSSQKIISQSLLYTALTRAREEICLWSIGQDLEKHLEASSEVESTFFAHWLEEQMQQLLCLDSSSQSQVG